MPKVTYAAFAKKGIEIGTLIFGRMAVRDLSIQDMAGRTGISEGRLYARRKKPEDLTVGELVTLGRNLGIPIDELRSALRY